MKKDRSERDEGHTKEMARRGDEASGYFRLHSEDW